MQGTWVSIVAKEKKKGVIPLVNANQLVSFFLVTFSPSFSLVSKDPVKGANSIENKWYRLIPQAFSNYLEENGLKTE